MKSEIKDNNNFKQILENEVKKIGLNVTDKQLVQFEQYKNMLVEWNEKINLTAIVEDYDVIMKHFIDCLEIVKYIDNNSKIVDVGTGAGFPGIVIAIYFEGNVEITLLDALNKRLIFLQEVVDKLQLKNVKIVHGRAEEMAQKEEYREKYDIAVSRAVANLGALLEFDTPYIKVNGKCLFLKGDKVQEEIIESKKALEILNCKINNNYTYKYNVNEEEYTRNILEIKKIKNTPNKYPRNYGKIKKNPLK